MKNSLEDLVNHCFVALERLNEEGISAETMAKELQRANAVSTVAREIINAGRLAVDAQKLCEDSVGRRAPRLLGLAPTEVARPRRVV